MNPIVAFFKAIRLQNLVVGALTMYGIRYGVLIPLVKIHSVDLQLTHVDFALLVLSFVLIAGAGNIINDYFDLKIDRINKPDRIIIGRYIKRRVAMASHIILNGIAMVLAGYVAWRSGSIELALIHVILIGTLWFYSTDFKRRFVWGSLSIAFCTALIPFSIALFEIPPLVEAYTSFLEEHPQAYVHFQELIFSILYWCLGFSGFAFLLTFAREVTKDIVDQKGDIAYDCQTIPIILGTKKAVYIINSVYALVIVSVFAIQHFILPDKMTLLYIMFLLGPIILLSFYLTARARTDQQFYFPAQMNKLATVVGIGYTLVVYYILTFQM